MVKANQKDIYIYKERKKIIDGDSDSGENLSKIIQQNKCDFRININKHMNMNMNMNISVLCWI